jgi:hypothetical protein
MFMAGIFLKGSARNSPLFPLLFSSWFTNYVASWWPCFGEGRKTPKVGFHQFLEKQSLAEVVRSQKSSLRKYLYIFLRHAQIIAAIPGLFWYFAIKP